MAEFPQSGDPKTLATFIAWDFAKAAIPSEPGKDALDELLTHFQQAYETVRQIQNEEPSKPPSEARTIPR